MANTNMNTTSCWIGLVAAALLFHGGAAGAQMSGDALVTSDADSIVAVDLSNGAQTTVAGPAVELLGALDLAEEASGNVVVTRLSNVVRVTFPGGTNFSQLAGVPDLVNPFGIAVSPTGDILVADFSLLTASAVAIDPASGVAADAIDPIPGALAETAFDVAVDSTDNLYVAYSSVIILPQGQFSLIAKVAPGTTTPTTLTDTTSGPASGQSFNQLASDGGDTLVVATDDQELFLVDADTGVTTFLSSGGALDDIQGVTFDDNGDVLVIDTTNGIVRVTQAGSQSVVPNSVVSQPSGIIVYTPEPGLLGSLGAAVGFVSFLARRRRGSWSPVPR